MREYNTKKKIYILIVLLLIISVGYAALTTQLKINGTASVNKNTWNVYWDNVANVSGVETEAPVIGNDENNGFKTKVEWSVTLDKPGDYYEFTVDAVNEGTIDAMITNITHKLNGEEISDVNKLPDYINYNVTYKNGIKLKNNQILKKNTKETYKLKIEFLNTITNEQLNSIPDEGLSYTFDFEITYAQADNNAIIVGMGNNPENSIMLDVARRYYTIDEIKSYIDILSTNKNSSLQLHLTDDENVGIECKYLDQTKSNATESNGIYTNPVTNKQFLTYEQMDEIKAYAKNKNVTLIPEIDIPAHMNGFFTLAINKFGENYVRAPYDWDNQENSGIAWGSGDEKGNIDLALPQAKLFIKNIYDEYTEYFKDLDYFHAGFDEYTFRPELKIDYANEIYEYLKNKGFKMRMWSDAITKTNIKNLNNKIEINYWGWKESDITETNYATVPDLQNNNFNILITNKYYLFFVPSVASTTQESLDFSVNKIKNDWTIEKWNYSYDSKLDSYENILGGLICIWSENSEDISSQTIINHTKNLYNEMILKLKY